MRLINTRTLRLHEFLGTFPPYAILSHTWGKDEVSFQDFHSPGVREEKAGYAKIVATCNQARKQGLEYAWVDTCCVDKTSSAELGEAINSMFKWYRDSSVCYAFLEDVSKQQSSFQSKILRVGEVGLGHSRWFTRGWTLQELIAPRHVEFYSQEWEKVGEKSSMAEQLQSITGIDTFVLKGGPLHQVSVGKRMSWASRRQTSREEDMAYSLFGIFNVNMPLIYGEGPRAFLRLQEEILRQSDDHTLFAWHASASEMKKSPLTGFFATSPKQFQNFLRNATITMRDTGLEQGTGIAMRHIVRVWDNKAPQNPMTLTNKGIRFTSRVFNLGSESSHGLMILILNCSPGGDPFLMTGIYVRRQREDCYARFRPDLLVEVRVGEQGFETRTIHGLKSTADVVGHHYDEPWTSSAKISQEAMYDELHGYLDASESVQDRYKHAIHVDRSSFRRWTFFGQYHLHAIFIGSGREHLRFFRFDSQDHVDLVIKNHAGFTGMLVMKSVRSPSDLLLIFVATERRGNPETLWCDGIGIREEDFAQSFGQVLHFFSNLPKLSSSTDPRVKLAGSLLQFRVTVEPALVEDLPMHSLRISGPWPTSFWAWIQLTYHFLFLIFGCFVSYVLFFFFLL